MSSIHFAIFNCNICYHFKCMLMETTKWHTNRCYQHSRFHAKTLLQNLFIRYIIDVRDNQNACDEIPFSSFMQFPNAGHKICNCLLLWVYLSTKIASLVHCTYPNIVAFGRVDHRMRCEVDTMLIEIFIENEEIKITWPIWNR